MRVTFFVAILISVITLPFLSEWGDIYDADTNEPISVPFAANEHGRVAVFREADIVRWTYAWPFNVQVKRNHNGELILEKPILLRGYAGYICRPATPKQISVFEYHFPS